MSETQDPDYTAVIGGDCAPDGSITLAATDVKTCTITNTFKAPKLTVTKTVINTGGGTKQPATSRSSSTATRSPTASADHVDASAPHTVSETPDPNYTAVIGGDCAANGSITLAAGDVKTCTITNTFKAPKLTVSKTRQQHRRRHQAARRLPALRRRQPGHLRRQQITSSVGAHTVSETPDPDYTAVIGGDCAANGSITLAAGDVKTCTITNTFKAPKLTVSKTREQHRRRHQAARRLPALRRRHPRHQRSCRSRRAVGPHTVSETPDPNYTAVIGGDCAANGSITLAAGDVKTCTITNTFNAAPRPRSSS